LIQKKKDLRPSRQWKLVRNHRLLLVSKAYFPAWIRADPDIRAASRRLGLVYLTWTTLFVSAGIHIEKRGSTRLHDFHRGGTELRSSRYSGRSNSVDICISLYDVNASEEAASDWTVKDCDQSLTIKSGFGGA